MYRKLQGGPNLFGASRFAGIAPIFVAATVFIAACTSHGPISKLDVTNGVQASAQTFPAVVFMTTYNASTNISNVCTGTFVGSNTILTAAHCLDDAQTNGGSPQGNLTVHIGGPGGQTIPVLNVYFPQWAGMDNYQDDNDLAVLVVQSQTTPAIMPIAIAAPQVAQSVTLVGYGSVIAGDESASDNPNNQFYQGSNTILAFGFADNQIITLGESGTGIESQAGQNSVTGPGDSGGPMIVGNDIVGVSHSDTTTLTTDSLTQHYSSVFSAATLAFIQQKMQTGSKFAMGFHENTAFPAYQEWLQGLTSKGANIQFDGSPSTAANLNNTSQGAPFNPQPSTPIATPSKPTQPTPISPTTTAPTPTPQSPPITPPAVPGTGTPSVPPTTSGASSYPQQGTTVPCSSIDDLISNMLGSTFNESSFSDSLDSSAGFSQNGGNSGDSTTACASEMLGDEN